jgi:hypothetical protein
MKKCPGFLRMISSPFKGWKSDGQDYLPAIKSFTFFSCFRHSLFLLVKSFSTIKTAVYVKKTIAIEMHAGPYAAIDRAYSFLPVQNHHGSNKK